MRRTVHLRAAAALLALAPLMSACTITIGDKDGDKNAAPAPAATSESPAPTTAAAAPSTETSAPAPAPTATETPTQDTTPQTTASQNTGANGSAQGREIAVPAGHGISKLELIDLYGGDTASGSYGKAVGVFKVTTDRPMLIKLRITLYAAAGKEIAHNDGLNPAYTVGTHHLVTSNLIKLPTGATPKTFKVSLVDTTEMRYTTVTKFDEPRLTTKNGVPALTGSFTLQGKMPSSLDARGACVLPGGKTYEGRDGLTDDSAGGTYTIPLYDARGGDLSKATCYASV